MDLGEPRFSEENVTIGIMSTKQGVRLAQNPTDSIGITTAIFFGYIFFFFNIFCCSDWAVKYLNLLT